MSDPLSELDPSKLSSAELWRLADRMGEELVRRGVLRREVKDQPEHVHLLDYKLPIDVRVPPATVITKGCSLKTLIIAMRRYERLQSPGAINEGATRTETVPNPYCCVHPGKCRGLTSCPRRPACSE